MATGACLSWKFENLSQKAAGVVKSGIRPLGIIPGPIPRVYGILLGVAFYSVWGFPAFIRFMKDHSIQIICRIRNLIG